jgi:hypothetical protein
LTVNHFRVRPADGPRLRPAAGQRRMTDLFGYPTNGNSQRYTPVWPEWVERRSVCGSKDVAARQRRPEHGHTPWKEPQMSSGVLDRTATGAAAVDGAGTGWVTSTGRAWSVCSHLPKPRPRAFVSRSSARATRHCIESDDPGPRRWSPPRDAHGRCADK